MTDEIKVVVPVQVRFVEEGIERFAGQQVIADKLAEVDGEFSAEASEAALRSFAEETEVKSGLLINASRTALTGQAVGPSMFEVFEVIGRDRSAVRLRAAALLV